MAAVVVTTSALVSYFYRYVSRQCESMHHFNGARGEALPSTEPPSAVVAGADPGFEDMGDESTSKPSARSSEAETTRLIGHV